MKKKQRHFLNNYLKIIFICEYDLETSLKSNYIFDFCKNFKISLFLSQKDATVNKNNLCHPTPRKAKKIKKIIIFIVKAVLYVIYSGLKIAQENNFHENNCLLIMVYLHVMFYNVTNEYSSPKKCYRKRFMHDL